MDDGKLSERTISDELPQVRSASSEFIEITDITPASFFLVGQESSKAEQDVSHPEQDGTSMNGNAAIAISNDSTPADTGESNQVLPSTKEKHAQPCYAESIVDADQLNICHHEGADSIAAEPKKKSALDSDKSIKLNPPDKSGATAHSGGDTKQEDLVASGEETNGAADDTSRPADITPVKPRRGRPPGPKSSEKKAAAKNKPSSLDLKKAEEASDSAGKLTKRSAKDEVKSSVKKAGEAESSKKPQKSSSKQQKDEALSEEDPAEDLSLKVFP